MPSAPVSETAPKRSPSGGAERGGESAGGRIDPGSAHALLLAAVQHHALPRLLAAHGGARLQKMPAAASRPGVEPADVENLLSCVSTPDFHLAESALAAIARRGFSRSELLVDLLTPAARMLRRRWRQDEETFAAVALATGRLQRLLRSAAMPAPEASRAATGGSVLVGSRTDDPRPLEAAVVADFFRSAQWDAECLTPRTTNDLADRMAARPFDLCVLMLDPDAGSEPESGLVHRLRTVSANRGLVVLLSGVPAGSPLEHRLKPDGAVADATRTVAVAQELVFGRVA